MVVVGKVEMTVTKRILKLGMSQGLMETMMVVEGAGTIATEDSVVVVNPVPQSLNIVMGVAKVVREMVKTKINAGQYQVSKNIFYQICYSPSHLLRP